MAVHRQRDHADLRAADDRAADHPPADQRAPTSAVVTTSAGVTSRSPSVPPTTPGTGACTASYRTTNSWSGGFQGR
ncbi:hypothetical protein ACFQX7_33365 [Luedemannella flava]